VQKRNINQQNLRAHNVTDNTKLKTEFRQLLCNLARKWIWPIEP